MFPKVAQINTTEVFTSDDRFQNSLKSRQSFRATFVNKFVAKIFLKSHNLVTLGLSIFSCFTLILSLSLSHVLPFSLSHFYFSSKSFSFFTSLILMYNSPFSFFLSFFFFYLPIWCTIHPLSIFCSFTI